MEAAGHQASHGVVNAVKNAFASGGRQAVDADTARQGLKIRGIPEEQRKVINEEAPKLAKEFRGLPLGELISTLGEGALQTQDFSNFKETARLMAATMQLHTANTGSAEEGKRAAVVIAKAADAMGRMDKPDEARSYMGAISKAMVYGGQDIRPDTVMAIVRNLKSTKMGLTAKGIEDIVGLGDDLGQRVGNSASQLESFLSGTGKKSSHAEMQRIGLEGKDGKQKVSYGGNPIDYIMNTFGPAIRKAGVDTNNAEAVNSYLRGKLGAKDTISDIISTVLSREAEIRRNRENRSRIDTSPEASAKLAFESLAMTGKSLEASFGELTDAVTGKVTPAMRTLGEIAAGAVGKAADVVRSNDVTPAGVAGGVAGIAGIIGGGMARAGGAVAEMLGMSNAGKALEVVGRFGMKWGGAVGAATTTLEGFTFLLKKASEDRQAEINSGSPLGKVYADADKRRNERGERQRAIVKALGERAAEAVTGKPANTLPTFANAGTPGNPLSVQIDKIRSDFSQQKNGVFRTTVGGVEGKDGPGFQANMPSTMANLNELVMKIDAEFAKLDPAAAKFGAAIDSIPGKGTAFGQAAGSTLVSQGAAFGQAAAAAFNANAKVPAPRAESSGIDRP